MNPNMNPRENLSRKLKVSVHSRQHSNLVELNLFDFEEWNNNPKDICRILFNNYRKRLSENLCHWLLNDAYGSFLMKLIVLYSYLSLTVYMCICVCDVTITINTNAKDFIQNNFITLYRHRNRHSHDSGNLNFTNHLGLFLIIPFPLFLNIFLKKICEIVWQ